MEEMFVFSPCPPGRWVCPCAILLFREEPNYTVLIVNAIKKRRRDSGGAGRRGVRETVLICT
jgi:hypothetical protein